MCSPHQERESGESNQLPQPLNTAQKMHFSFTLPRDWRSWDIEMARNKEELGLSVSGTQWKQLWFPVGCYAEDPAAFATEKPMGYHWKLVQASVIVQVQSISLHACSWSLMPVCAWGQPFQLCACTPPAWFSLASSATMCTPVELVRFGLAVHCWANQLWQGTGVIWYEYKCSLSNHEDEEKENILGNDKWAENSKSLQTV